MRAASLAMAVIPGLALLQACSLVLQGARTESRFRNGLTSQHYAAEPARTAAIVSGARQIRICSRRSDVKRLMGEPDFGVLTYDPNGNHTAVRWTYLINEAPAGGRAVDVSLNKAGEVFSIVPLGVADINIQTVNDGPGCQVR